MDFRAIASTLVPIGRLAALALIAGMLAVVPSTRLTLAQEGNDGYSIPSVEELLWRAEIEAKRQADEDRRRAEDRAGTIARELQERRISDDVARQERDRSADIDRQRRDEDFRRSQRPR
jgi:hypothetical protein